jgi:hypothetical protein
MPDKVTGKSARTLHTDPPTPDYRQIGWHCIYHEQAGRSCHNPLDCDLIPVWALTVKAGLSRIVEGSQ